MKWFNDLKIREKMILGFALIIVMLTGIALFAINRLSEVAVIYNNTLKYPVNTRDAIIETQSAFNDLRTATNRIAVFAPTGDTDLLDKAYQDAVSAYELAENNIQKFENLMRTNPLLHEGERSIRLYNAGNLKSYVQQYKNEICDPIMNAARTGEYERCVEILRGTEKIVDETGALVTSLREMAAAVAERSSGSALLTADRSKILLVTTSAVSIVISVILALFIASIIARPIIIMTDVANNVAKGNLDVHIGAPAKDETGMLAKSFSNIIDIVNSLTTDLKNLSKHVHADGNTDTGLNAARFSGAYGEVVESINSLARAWEEAEAANRAKNAFLANMSHELRMPLNVVIGLTGLILENKYLDNRVTDNLVKINNAGSTILNIVNDVLDFSEIESGKFELTTAEYYTASMLNDIITYTIARLGEKPVKFRLNINNDLPYKLYGDDLRVKHIFTNLLTNAVKYTNEGSVDLSVRCAREIDTIWMNVTISDTGMGISADDLKNLFLDYQRVDARSNRHVEGTGLGLSITKRLVEMMGGEINVESEYGKGSTFSFRIRQGFVNDAVLGADVCENLRNFSYSDDKHIVSQKLVRIDLSYARVLVVDDIKTNLDVVSGLLGSYRMQVDCLTDGPSAIEKIKAGTPVYNAIFMDHMMPGMDGIETADRIRALDTEYARNIPIIALTANAIRGTEKMFYEHDFQAYVNKPIDVMEVDSVLRKWVRDNTREDVLINDELSEAELKIENMVIEIPGVDTEKGLSLYGGVRKIYLPMLRSYAYNTPKVLNKLRLVSEENLHDYVIIVHGLKGTSAALGAEQIRAEALELENLSRTGDLQGVLAKNGKLIADTEIIVANVKKWLDKNDVHEIKPKLKAPDRELLEKLREYCESYDIDGIDEIMSDLERNDYEEDTDLITWLREKINISKMGDAAKRLEEELAMSKRQ
jgi:signal transduction histidine kinase/AmiR/NasT family two-component response regulator/HPt (histidine-containing phosphotransfer) domain-containing protein